MTVLLLLAFLVFLPAVIALFHETSLLHRASAKPTFRIGTPVVYRHEEVSLHPASDAHDVRPAERGEYYYYAIINYLRVAEVLGDGRIIAIADNNERWCFWPDNSSLRKARLTERLRHRLRFPNS